MVIKKEVSAMANHPYIATESIVQKYLKYGEDFFDKNVMQPGWFGFYEPNYKYSDSIPSMATRDYKYKESAAPINFIILNTKTTSVGESAFENQKDLLLFDAKSSDGLRIEKNSFKNCAQLYKICLPFETESLDKTAFYGCNKLSIVEMMRGEWDGKKLAPEQRKAFGPLEYNVIMIGGYPYIWDAKETPDNAVYKVRKLVIDAGKFQDPLICKQEFLHFGKIKGYPSLKVYGLGDTEQAADNNLKSEIEIICSAVGALQKSKTFSPEIIGAAIASLKTR